MSVLLPLLRRIVIWSVIAIAALFVFWGAFCLEERWRWKGAWNTYRSAALLRGAKLEVDTLQQPAISDEENFAAAPIIREVFADPTKGGSNAKWFAAVKMESYRRPKLTKPLQSGITDLPSLRDHFVAQGILSEPSDSVAADVLRTLERVEPEFSQLRDAGRRPKARFPLNSELGIEAPQPHLIPLLSAARVYPVAITAHLQLGESASAYQSLREMMRLYEVLRDEPTLITAMIRLTIVALADATIRDGLASDRWAEPELQALAIDYARFDWFSECQHSLSTERVYMNKTCDVLLAQSSAKLAQKMSGWGLLGSLSTSPLLSRVAVSAYPRGWLYLSQLKLNEYYDGQITRIESLKNGAVPQPSEEQEDELAILSRKSVLRTLPYWSAVSSVSTVQGVVNQYLQIIAQTRITQIAFQLARYRSKNSAFPDALDDLVPDNLPEVPRDPMDLAPIRYRQTPTGYDLWSIGLDRINDGGKSLPETAWRDQPDWVFQH